MLLHLATQNRKLQGSIARLPMLAFREKKKNCDSDYENYMVLDGAQQYQYPYFKQ